MDLKKRAVIAETVYSQKVDGELVLLDMKSECYFGLDKVGTDIWRLLEEGKSLEETLEEMLDMYEVEPDLLRSDLESLVQKLSERGLIELS